MENSNNEVMGISPRKSCPKVHSSICSELTMMLDKISCILPSIEAARPGCKAGIQELCNLYNVVEKGKLIILHCIECSKLYLAITGDTVVARCERIRDSLRRSLFLIQNMVPPALANQIVDVHDDLRDVTFVLDPLEEEAGKAILQMLRQSDASEELELETFLQAASKLDLMSPKAILIERRAIKKLLDKVSGNDAKKEGVLKFFLYLIKKYGKSIRQDSGERNENLRAESQSLTPSTCSHDSSPPGKCSTSADFQRYEDHSSMSGAATPPAEFCCPLDDGRYGHSREFLVDLAGNETPASEAGTVLQLGPPSGEPEVETGGSRTSHPQRTDVPVHAVTARSSGAETPEMQRAQAPPPLQNESAEPPTDALSKLRILSLESPRALHYVPVHITVITPGWRPQGLFTSAIKELLFETIKEEWAENLRKKIGQQGEVMAPPAEIKQIYVGVKGQSIAALIRTSPDGLVARAHGLTRKSAPMLQSLKGCTFFPNGENAGTIRKALSNLLDAVPRRPTDPNCCSCEEAAVFGVSCCDITFCARCLRQGYSNHVNTTSQCDKGGIVLLDGAKRQAAEFGEGVICVHQIAVTLQEHRTGRPTMIDIFVFKTFDRISSFLSGDEPGSRFTEVYHMRRNGELRRVCRFQRHLTFMFA